MITKQFALLLGLLILLPIWSSANTVDAEAWRLAQKQYPELRDANSLLYRVVAAEAARLARENREFFNDPQWTLKLVHSLVPERVRLKFTVSQAVADGALVKAIVGRFDKVPSETAWGPPNLLTGRPRSDIAMKPGVIWSHDTLRVFVLGLKDYYEGQSGEVDVYPAGDYNYSTVLGADMRVPRFAVTASLAVAATRGQK